VLIRFAKIFCNDLPILLRMRDISAWSYHSGRDVRTGRRRSGRQFASDGDTIVIPAGRCTWTTNLTITDKILTIQGAGIDQTTIVDGLSKDTFRTSSSVDLQHQGRRAHSNHRFTFQGGSIPDAYNKGMVAIGGLSLTWRVDHNRFVTTMTFWAPSGGPRLWRH